VHEHLPKPVVAGIAYDELPTILVKPSGFAVAWQYFGIYFKSQGKHKASRNNLTETPKT